MTKWVPILALMALTALPVDAQTSARDRNKAIAHRYFDELLNKGNLGALDTIVSPDVIFRNPPVVVRGIDEFRTLIAGLRAAFPDLNFRLEDEIVEGNKVATRWVMRGTMGDRKMDVSGMDIFLVVDGKIKEIWVNMDTLTQAQQLGRVPAAP